MPCDGCLDDIRDLIASCDDMTALKQYITEALERMCDDRCSGQLTTVGLNPVQNPAAATLEAYPILPTCDCTLLVIRDTDGNLYFSADNGSSYFSVAGSGTGSQDISGTAGENLDLWDYVYLDETTDSWFKVDADATPIRCGRWRGFVNVAAIGIGAVGSIRLSGEIDAFSGLTAGSPVYGSNTAGGITQTRPAPVLGGSQVAIIEIGLAISTTKVLVSYPRDVPVQYLQRASLANNASLTLQHHKAAKGHTRRPYAYGSIDTIQYTADLCVGITPLGNMTAADGLAGAFDNNVTTRASNSGTTGIIGCDFGVGNAKQIIRYTVQHCTAVAVTQMGQAWTFQWSDDNVAWTTADTRSGQTGWTSGEIRTFDFASAGAHRYWRLNISNNNGAGNTSVGELEMMEGTTVTYEEPNVIGAWSGGTRDIATRYDNGSGASNDTQTTLKNVKGATADLTVAVEIL
jgi:hypothetical protein